MGSGQWGPPLAIGHSPVAEPSWRPRLVARQQVGGELHRLDDLHIAGAAADVAAERLADLRFGRARVAAQEAGRSHDEARRTVAALGAQLLVEAALDGREGA